jgi:hypothetical protein
MLSHPPFDVYKDEFTALLKQVEQKLKAEDDASDLIKKCGKLVSRMGVEAKRATSRDGDGDEALKTMLLQITKGYKFQLKAFKSKNDRLVAAAAAAVAEGKGDISLSGEGAGDDNNRKVNETSPTSIHKHIRNSISKSIKNGDEASPKENSNNTTKPRISMSMSTLPLESSVNEAVSRIHDSKQLLRTDSELKRQRALERSNARLAAAAAVAEGQIMEEGGVPSDTRQANHEGKSNRDDNDAPAALPPQGRVREMATRARGLLSSMWRQ